MHYDGVSLGQLPQATQEEATAWANNQLLCARETSQMGEYITALTRTCRTFGQMVRIWPAMAGLFEGEARRRIDAQRARSALPVWAPSVLLNPETQAKMDELLASALMLPQVPDNQYP